MYESCFLNAKLKGDSDVPWTVLDAPSKLCRYIAGGGVMAFGRTLDQDRRDYAQTRFLSAAGIVLIVYLILWIT
ncbi:MAG: hypothetical protein IKO64_06125 [Kiritimatiellae bacterium]|nr:hypothetical protein [Kiritimatiellia bacterium]